MYMACNHALINAYSTDGHDNVNIIQTNREAKGSRFNHAMANFLRSAMQRLMLASCKEVHISGHT